MRSSGPTTIPIVDFVISLFDGRLWSWLVIAIIVAGLVASFGAAMIKSFRRDRDVR